jgi:transcriptional regulatory protein LevR
MFYCIKNAFEKAKYKISTRIEKSEFNFFHNLLSIRRIHFHIFHSFRRRVSDNVV